MSHCGRTEKKMAIQIIADSCCDLTPALQNVMDIKLVSFQIKVGENNFVDDKNINLKTLLETIKNTKTAASTACPSPEEFADFMRKAQQSFVITLSSKLSGSYNSAIVAKEMVLEEFPDKEIHVIDSKSASATETNIAIAMYEQITQGKSFEDIKVFIDNFIKGLRTRFVLEDLSTLVKNGRITKAAGLVGSVLSLRPIMADNGDGEIICIEKIRGTKQALVKLVENVKNETQNCAKQSLTLVMTYCNCAERAQDVKKDILAKCDAIKEVIAVPTAGLSTVYANDGGIILSY